MDMIKKQITIFDRNIGWKILFFFSLIGCGEMIDKGVFIINSSDQLVEVSLVGSWMDINSNFGVSFTEEGVISYLGINNQTGMVVPLQFSRMDSINASGGNFFINLDSACCKCNFGLRGNYSLLNDQVIAENFLIKDNQVTMERVEVGVTSRPNDNSSFNASLLIDGDTSSFESDAVSSFTPVEWSLTDNGMTQTLEIRLRDANDCIYMRPLEITFIINNFSGDKSYELKSPRGDNSYAVINWVDGSSIEPYITTGAVDGDEIEISDFDGSTFTGDFKITAKSDNRFLAFQQIEVFDGAFQIN